MMNAIIIEDEKKNVVRLKSKLEKNCTGVTVVGVAHNADEGIELIYRTRPDLVFLDIQMPNKSGFEMLAEMTSYDFEVIFVTAFDQYGIQAVKCSALDYLLKPVKPVELVHAVEKAKARRLQKNDAGQIRNLLANIQQQNLTGHRITVSFLNEERYLLPSDILRCESINGYTRFYMIDKTQLLVSRPIAEYEQMLQPYGFIRCHQSHLVNKSFVKSVLREHNISELLLTNGTRVPLSRLKKEFVKKSLSTQ